MARANRLRGDGGVFHLTHRCHNRSFLLKFARDREAYRALVREHLQSFDVALLDYCVTSNHVHLLVDACKRLEVSLAERMARDQAKRQACWTESLAVGSRGFVEKVQPLILSRRETEVVATTETIWSLQEEALPYGQKMGTKIASKAHHGSAF